MTCDQIRYREPLFVRRRSDSNFSACWVSVKHLSSCFRYLSPSRELFFNSGCKGRFNQKKTIMVCFEFEISVVLAICVPVSCVVLWFTARAKEGGVKLPVHVGGEVTRNADTGGYLSGDDPFDVTKPEDIIDGYPIDEDGFWKRVSNRYLFSSVLPNLSFFFSSSD